MKFDDLAETKLRDAGGTEGILAFRNRRQIEALTPNAGYRYSGPYLQRSEPDLP